jgi:hypothetical protein
MQARRPVLQGRALTSILLGAGPETPGSVNALILVIGHFAIGRNYLPPARRWTG